MINKNSFKNNLMKKIILSIFAVLICLSMVAQSNQALKLNLEKNKVYRFRSSSEQTILQTVNGNQQTVESKTDYTLSIKMIDATAELMVAEVHLDTLITKTNTNGKTIIMSSASEGDIKSTEVAAVMSCIMNRLSKNALYVKMDFTGKVNEIVNLKMLSAIVTKDTSSITGQTAPALKAQITNMVSDKALKPMIEAFTYYLPGKQVATGENWSINVTANSGGMSLDIITTYRLDGVTGSSANVTAESNIKASANADPIVSGGAKITYDDLKGLSKSTMVIDINTGLLVEEKSKTHITGNLGVNMPGLSMQIPMDIDSSTKVISLQ
jgi:hypothetical protein